MSMAPAANSGQYWTSGNPGPVNQTVNQTWGGGSGGSGQWTTNTVQWNETSPLYFDVSCLFCEDPILGEDGEQMTNNTGIDVCELCRLAVMEYRRQVLRNMARDLLKMGE